MKSERDDSKGGVEVGAVRAPVAEPAPLPKTSPSCKWELCRAPLSSPPRPGCGARHHHDADDAADPAPREPSAPTADPGTELARLLPGLLDLARARIKALTIPGPPPLNLASESIKLARACELLLGERERLTRDLGVSDAMVSRATRDLSDARARVAELEAANEGLARIVNDRSATPPGASVAALLAAIDRITFDAPDDKPNGPGEQAIDDMLAALDPEAWPLYLRPRIGDLNGYMATLTEAWADEARDLKAGAAGVRATLAPPSPLDRAVAAALAEHARIASLGPWDPHDHWAAICTEADSIKAGVAPGRDRLIRVGAEALAALLACDASATKEPG